MKKKLFVVFISLLHLSYLSAQNTSLHFQFKGVEDEFANEFAIDIINDAMRQSQIQVDDTLYFVMTYEQKKLTVSYSAKESKISGLMQRDNADLYSDLEEIIRKVVAKSLEDLKSAVKSQEESEILMDSEITDNTKSPQQIDVVPPKAEKTPSVVTNDDTRVTHKIMDKTAIWRKIQYFITLPRNKSDKIVSLKTSGKLSTFTTLKSGLTAVLTDEGVLKIRGKGRMLTEDEFLLKDIRSYVVAIEVEEGITDVSGFQKFASVEYVLLPNTVRVIAPFAFKDCTKLSFINIPESTTEIGASAFENCEALSVLFLPDELSNIGEKAFMGCRKLQSIKLPSSINVIAKDVFRNCLSLESVEIPLSVQQIGENAFRKCCSITKLFLSDNVVSIEKGCFQDMEMLTELRLSERLVLIPSGAFEGCSSLNSVVVPKSVQMVSDYAFKNCKNLAQITFLCPNMTNLGEFCFEDCKRLSTIYMHSQYPPACSDMFDSKDIKARVVIVVPKSSESFYKDAKYWKTLTIKSM